MSKIRKAARGRECQLRIPGACNHDPSTTVLAHLGGGGIGRKQPDIFAAFACSSCHDAVDGRIDVNWDNTLVALWFYQGVIRTQEILLKEGLIKI